MATRNTALKSLRQARPRPVRTVGSLLGVFIFSGIFLQLLPASAPVILGDWQLHETRMALPMAGVLVGTGIGTVTGGVLADVLGRRSLIGSCIVLLAMLEAAASYTVNPAQLSALMFLAGLSMGGFFAAAMALVTELVPLRRRGLVVSLTVAGPPLGLSLCSFTAGLLLPEHGWQTLFRLAALLGIPVALGFFLFVPESPAFLIRHPARRGEFLRLNKTLGLQLNETTLADSASEVVVPLRKRLATLVRADPLATIGLWGLFFGSYIFGNAILSWVPVSLARLGFSISFASGALTAWTAASIFGTPFAGWLLSSVGIRAVAVASSAVGALVVLSISFIAWTGNSSEPLFLSTLALGGVATAGLVSALLTLVADTYPPDLRSSGIGLCDAMGRIGGVCSAYFGVYVIALGGPAALFTTLALLMTTMAFYLLLLHPYPRKPAA